MSPACLHLTFKCGLLEDINIIIILQKPMIHLIKSVTFSSSLHLSLSLYPPSLTSLHLSLSPSILSLSPPSLSLSLYPPSLPSLHLSLSPSIHPSCTYLNCCPQGDALGPS